MSSNSSNSIVEAAVVNQPTPPKRPLSRRILICAGLPVWVFLGFMLAQAIIIVLIEVLQKLGVPFDQINDSLFQVIAGGVVYTLSLIIVIGVPWWVKKARTTKEDLGIQRLPNWMDFVWAPTGAIAYLILTAIITLIAMNLLTFVDYNQQQETGFANISTQSEIIMAFIMLVIIAPIAEELLFRGYLFGKLRKYAPLWVAILITSVVFAIVHFAWNVGLDVFALSIVLCLLRVISGSLWPSIMLHMMKNGLAFYFLFINPTLLSTLGG
ncbi:MAG: type II CAAX endopeptidase family protein [Patescibacteria group bacterium]